MNKKLVYLILLFSSMQLSNCTSSSLKPWDKGAFETGEYRNLLAEMGYNQSDIDNRLEEVYFNLFEGENKIYFEVGDSMAYISDIKNNDVRTEGCRMV